MYILTENNKGRQAFTGFPRRNKGQIGLLMVISHFDPEAKEKAPSH
ncbi:hypothetical protein SD78_4417 [Bacillus badius]|nr:hypothetical protein SD78_4417 [Bacillus badius]